MIYSFTIICFIIISHHFLISNASPSVEDKMLIAFVRNDQKMQISEFTKQKYEAHLGILYFMRKNWHCDKKPDEFEEYERTKCQKYRKYLDILYEYLFREYIGIHTVKPKFVFKREIEINGPIIYAVFCLARISQFYFKSYWSKRYEYKLNKLFFLHFELKLLNEKRLNYDEQKLSINEMILQLAIDTANEWQTNESLEGIIRQNFEGNLEEMLKKAEEQANKDKLWKANKIKDDKNWIIVGSEFDDQWEKWNEDAFFSEFVKGLATNSAKFFKMAKEYSNCLSRKKEKGNRYWYDRLMISYGLYEIEKMNEYLTQKYEAHLGVVYLMRENWYCDKIGKEFEEKERKLCQTNRKYLHILYEYLFRLYIEGKSNELAHKLSAVKPIFMKNYAYYQMNLISVIETLNKLSEYFWVKDRNISWNNKWKLIFENEVEFNYEIKEEENLLKKINGPKNVQKKENKILNLSNQFEDNLRQEFEQKMEKMYENTKQNAKEEKAKLEKAIGNASNNREKEILEKEYDDKFGTFISSPFS